MKLEVIFSRIGQIDITQDKVMVACGVMVVIGFIGVVVHRSRLHPYRSWVQNIRLWE